MRKFFEECETAIKAERRDTALKSLRRAHHIMQPLVAQAKARLELRLVTDLCTWLQWTAACIHAKGTGEWPGISPWDTAGGTSFVWPPRTRNRTSLDYRWSKRREDPESPLPSVPWTAVER